MNRSQQGRREERYGGYNGYRPSSQDIETIITGDPVASAQKTVECAREFGTALAQEIEMSQIRNVFSTVRRIEMNWREGTESPAQVRELKLLQPKLRYQTGRMKKFEPLAEVLVQAIEHVGTNRERFQRFVDFFEAILAYHKAAEGK